MCRIAGIISQKLSETEIRNRIGIMCDALRHGGPDDEGLFMSEKYPLGFGHRRLSIIDLSANGHQPMANGSKSVWITFNGEIYNYRQLREQLIQEGIAFTSDSDTEVIIRAYEKWGTESFAKLLGIFAFALHDAPKGFTYLVRDSAGIKPLYYFAEKGELYFASEVRAFAAAGLVTQPDAAWPIRFLAFGFIPEPHTTLQNVFSLPKNSFLTWNHTDNSWKIDLIPEEPASAKINTEADARQAVSQTLTEAVDRQMIADAPIGVFLSGGIDSSIITLLAAQNADARLKTVSIYFDENQYDERQYQQSVLNGIDCDNASHLVTREDFERELPNILQAIDMPTNDGINTWFISKYARQDGLKAVLSGVGADELFGGYPSFRRIKYLNSLKKLPKRALRLAGRLSSGRYKRVGLLAYDHPNAEYLFLRGLFVPEDIAAILGVPLSLVNKTLFGGSQSAMDVQGKERIASLESNIYMQNQLLRDTDVMSMNHGLEVRVPFLDEEFRKASQNIAPSIRFSDRPQKQLLIESFKNLLPKQVWDRPKMGFSFPLGDWMLQHEEIGKPEIYQNPDAQEVISQFRLGKVHWSKAYTLYQLQKKNVIAQNKKKSILLLTLQTYSTTGGIQKMTRILAYALQKASKQNNWNFDLWSGYDQATDVDTRYCDQINFKGFGINRIFFLLRSVMQSRQTDVVVLTHINLASVGLLIKKLNPNCQVWLIAHGIEVWRKLGTNKRNILKAADKIVCVSNFTRQKLIDMHGAKRDKCVVLNNAVDPFMEIPDEIEKPAYLQQRYGLKDEDKIIFSLTRLSSTELYKGYDQVIKAVAKLRGKAPGIKYILAGPYDEQEGNRVKASISKLNLGEQIILTGFLSESELKDHFLLADLFVLPSRKEGFGIVFIEAMACGLPVICGNADGSMDAIKHGELGKAVNADNLVELTNAIGDYFEQPYTTACRKEMQRKCLEYFNADTYTDALEAMLTD